MDLETVFPAKDRQLLALRMNNVLASPGFAGWMSGEPLDVQRLLYDQDGRPRLSILSIAHLSESERMFFVTILLNEIVSWVRTQSGTTSLRALLYMDEVFGYFPPTANPPSKRPMLTLLKQARAYGLGVILATQNPVDLDYKGLSNTGTWFLGRLQTERDKQRVMEGLEGASAAAGSTFDRPKMEAILAGLGKRVFLMNNVHDDEPEIFQTRFALSYLRGPLTRNQIQTLMADRKKSTGAADSTDEMPGELRRQDTVLDRPQNARPIVPNAAGECFVSANGEPAAQGRLVYRPALLGSGRVHYVQAKSNVDIWKSVVFLSPVWRETPDQVWDEAVVLEDGEPELAKQPVALGIFASPPDAVIQAKNYTTWKKSLANHLYRQYPLVLRKCRGLKQISHADETEGDFRIRLRQLAREKRDLEVEKLRKRYAPKLAKIQDQIRRADERLEREQSQYSQQKWQTAISVGTSILGALFGRKLRSSTNVTRAGTAMRKMGRTAREKGDIGRAVENVETLKEKLAQLDAEFEEVIEKAKEDLDPEQLTVEEYQVPPRKSDISVEKVVLAWTPWHVDATGVAEPLY